MKTRTIIEKTNERWPSSPWVVGAVTPRDFHRRFGFTEKLFPASQAGFFYAKTGKIPIFL
jgi:hypothetical protein